MADFRMRISQIGETIPAEYCAQSCPLRAQQRRLVPLLQRSYHHLSPHLDHLRHRLNPHRRLQPAQSFKLEGDNYEYAIGLRIVGDLDVGFPLPDQLQDKQELPI